jgi:hypothetical protein
MKNNFRTWIGGAITGLAFIFTIFIATGTTAQAQYRNDRDERTDRNAQSQRRDRNRADDQDRNRDWRRDRNQSRNRNNDLYNRNNRNNGNYGNGNYGGGYGNYGTYGNNGNYGGYGNSSQVAVNQGYQAGLSTGASDAQRRQSFDPQRSHYYRNASSQAFRQGFLRGYDQGYRQYAGYGNGNYGNGGYGNRSGRTGGILGNILGLP